MGSRLEQLYSFASLSKRFGVSRTTISNWYANGKFKTVYLIGKRRMRVPKSDIDRIEHELGAVRESNDSRTEETTCEKEKEGCMNE